MSKAPSEWSEFMAELEGLVRDRDAERDRHFQEKIDWLVERAKLEREIVYLQSQLVMSKARMPIVARAWARVVASVKDNINDIPEVRALKAKVRKVSEAGRVAGEASVQARRDNPEWGAKGAQAAAIEITKAHPLVKPRDVLVHMRKQIKTSTDGRPHDRTVSRYLYRLWADDKLPWWQPPASWVRRKNLEKLKKIKR
jgi:hypothetical protein